VPVREDGSPPESLVDRAADAAFNAAVELAQSEGREMISIFITLRLKPDGSGGEDTTVAGMGFEDGKDVFATLLSEAISTGRELGLTVVVAPLGKG
jgi:hypothetical protein